MSGDHSSGAVALALDAEAERLNGEDRLFMAGGVEGAGVVPEAAGVVPGPPSVGAVWSVASVAGLVDAVVVVVRLARPRFGLSVLEVETIAQPWARVLNDICPRYLAERSPLVAALVGTGIVLSGHVGELMAEPKTADDVPAADDEVS